ATSPRLSGDDDEKRLRPGDPLLLPFLGCDVIGRAVVLRLPEPALWPRTRTHAGTATNGAGACGTGPGSLGMGRRAAAVGRTLSTHAVVEAKVFAGRYYSPAGSTTGDLTRIPRRWSAVPCSVRNSFRRRFSTGKTGRRSRFAIGRRRLVFASLTSFFIYWHCSSVSCGSGFWDG